MKAPFSIFRSSLALPLRRSHVSTYRLVVAAVALSLTLKAGAQVAIPVSDVDTAVGPSSPSPGPTSWPYSLDENLTTGGHTTTADVYPTPFVLTNLSTITGIPTQFDSSALYFCIDPTHDMYVNGDTPSAGYLNYQYGAISGPNDDATLVADEAQSDPTTVLTQARLQDLANLFATFYLVAPNANNGSNATYIVALQLAVQEITSETSDTTPFSLLTGNFTATDDGYSGASANAEITEADQMLSLISGSVTTVCLPDGPFGTSGPTTTFTAQTGNTDGLDFLIGGSFDQTANEVSSVEMQDVVGYTVLPCPEPATYALWGAVVCLAALAWKKVSLRRPSAA